MVRHPSDPASPSSPVPRPIAVIDIDSPCLFVSISLSAAASFFGERRVRLAARRALITAINVYTATDMSQNNVSSAASAVKTSRTVRRMRFSRSFAPLPARGYGLGGSGSVPEGDREVPRGGLRRADHAASLTSGWPGRVFPSVRRRCNKVHLRSGAGGCAVPTGSGDGSDVGRGVQPCALVPDPK